MSTIVYFGAGKREQVDTLIKNGVRDILISFFYLPLIKYSIRELKEMGVRHLMFDSGAVSALHVKGVSIDLKDYSDFVNQNQSSADAFIQLDVIPSEISTAGIREASKQTVDNYMTQTYQHKVDVIPVVRAESTYAIKDVLYLYLKHTDYIAFSGLARFNAVAPLIRPILRSHPTVRVHGLALAGATQCKAFNFYSVDSTTWAKTPAFSGYSPFGQHKSTFKDYTQYNLCASDIKDFKSHPSWSDKSTTSQNRASITIKNMLANYRKLHIIDY